MAEAGLQEVGIYVSRLQNKVAQYIADGPIMELCMAAKRRPDPRVAIHWWEQEGLDLEGMRMVDWEAKQTEGSEKTDGTETDTDE